MIGQGSHLETALRTLRDRLHDVGVALLRLDPDGDVAWAPGRDAHWLDDLLCHAAPVRRALRELAPRWDLEEHPADVEILPGCHAVPMPIVRRRQREGYVVGLVPSARLLDAEHLRAMCQSAELDYALTCSLLAQLPAVPEAEVRRLSSLVRHGVEDQMRLSADTQAIDSVGQQLAESYEEISLLYTVIQNMTVVQRPMQFIQVACQELLETLSYAWIGAQMQVDPDKLKQLSGRFIVAGRPTRDVAAIRRAVTGLLERAEPDAPIVIEPGRDSADAPAGALGRTVLAHPVCREGQVIGLLVAGEKQGPDQSVHGADLKLLGATASHMGIFLENAALYEDLNAMFLGTLEALTASIDAKDRYTCGHSERVALLTQDLARAVGLDDHTVGRMRIAGLVHDVGKIGVPERVLCKAGRLTREEFAQIQKHPEIGHHILKDIPQLTDILPGVLYHHERWDGRGYPAGLSGESIPLVGRLIALADSFDAMSSNRTYRSALERDAVLREILQCAGSQFDPKLAPVFVKLDFAEYDRLVSEHREKNMEQARPGELA